MPHSFMGGDSMEALALYKKRYKVQVRDIDFTGKMKLSSLFLYFQDIAGIHAENLGMGRALMEKNNSLWVLARARVDILRYPKWKEEITIETWPQEPNRLEFMRDFYVKDSSGSILAKAVSVWVVIDEKTRRLKRAESIFPMHLSTIKERAIDCKLGRLKPEGKLNKVYKRKVRYSDIDINEHLNNAKYVDFIMDAFTIEEHKKHLVRSIEINYSKEALPGEDISFYTDRSQVDDNIIYMEGINEANGELKFKAQIIFEKNRLMEE